MLPLQSLQFPIVYWKVPSSHGEVHIRGFYHDTLLVEHSSQLKTYKTYLSMFLFMIIAHWYCPCVHQHVLNIKMDKRWSCSIGAGAWCWWAVPPAIFIISLKSHRSMKINITEHTIGMKVNRNHCLVSLKGLVIWNKN